MVQRLPVYSLYFLKYVKRVLARSVLVMPDDVPVRFVFQNNFINYVFLLLCTFRTGYSVLLCCSVYCLCVNVYCTTATGCQPNCN